MLVFSHLLWAVVLPFFDSVSFAMAKYTTAYACDGKVLKIECEESDMMINLIRANYGRYSITVCNDHGSTEWSVNCMSHKSFNILQTRCHHKTNCSVLASTSLFGDPCPGTVKYLEAHYQCISSTASSSTSRPAPPWLMTSQPSVWSTAKSLTVPHEITTFSTTPTPTTVKVSSSVERERDNNKEDTNMSWPTFPPSSQITPELDIFSSTESHHPSSTENSWLFNDDKLPACKPMTVRNLSWNWTFGGEVSVQPCPGGAAGLAQWRCQAISKDIAIRFPDTPDLSDCRSVWLTSLENRIKEGDTVQKIASDLSQVTESKSLYGGDVIMACKLIRDMVRKMSEDMTTFVDGHQRKAVIYDLLQSVIRVGSNLLDATALPSWQDLAYSDQVRIATSLLVGIEENSFLLATSLSETNVVTQCEKNIVLRIQVMAIKDVGDDIFPISLAEQCSVRTSNYVQLRKNSLIQNSENGIVRVLYVAFDSLENILKTQTVGREKRRINSKVLSASLGKGRHIQLNYPVILCFEHLQTENVSNPSCVFWDYTQNMWSEEGCMLVSTNKTHTICQCNHLTNFAILVDVKGGGYVPNEVPVSLLVYIVGMVLILTIVALVAYQCFKQRSRKEYGSFVQDNIWISKCFTCCTSSSDSEKTLNCKDQRPTLYGNPPQNMVLDSDDVTIQPTHSIQHSSTLPRSFVTENGLQNHYHPHVKLNHSNYSTYNRNGSIRRIKEARRLEHIENALQHRNRKLSGTLGTNSPRSHTYSEISANAPSRVDPVYEEIEREREHCSQVSDISDEDGKRHSDMSRQSSKSYGDNRPLIPYNAVIQDHNFHVAFDAAFRQQLKEQTPRTVSVLDGQTVVCHLQHPEQQRIYNRSLGHSPHHY